MSARTKRIFHDENTRKKIQAAQLINRLTGHAMGEVEMTNSQVRAVEVLLKKVLPDLQAIEAIVDAEVESRVNVIERRIITKD